MKLVVGRQYLVFSEEKIKKIASCILAYSVQVRATSVSKEIKYKISLPVKKISCEERDRKMVARCEQRNKIQGKEMQEK